MRRLGEDLNRRTLAQALACVAEVESAIVRQGAILVDAGLAARDALAAGDRAEWLLTDAQREVTVWNRERLSGLLKLRAVEVPPAMEKFLDSRREHEQIKQLVGNLKQAADLDEGRKQQAASDDWFLSRLMRTVR
jgi:hypothetical protein